MVYRGYKIVCRTKPIPDRRDDWEYWPEDYDGPEDPRGGTCASAQECRARIDEEIEDPYYGNQP